MYGWSNMKFYIGIFLLGLVLSTPINVRASESVWIDTDPACGFSASSDVDDCLALVMALNSPELNIRGVHYPELKSQIKSIIAIAGKRPDQRFYAQQFLALSA